MTERKLLKNSLCPDWPSYMLSNQNQVVRNAAGQMAKIQDAKTEEIFRPTSCDRVGGKPMKPVFTYGMSKDSPFRNAYTKEHPLTKQLLDDGAKRASRKIEHVKHPKLFTTIMRQGLSKEM